MNLFKKGILIASALFAGHAGAETLHAMIRLNEKMPLENLAAEVKMPGTAHFGVGYSPEEILRLAGPSDAEYSSVITQLQNEGFTITSETKTHLWIGVQGDSQLFAKVFQAQLQSNSDGTRKLQSEVRVPTHMTTIASVGGLDSSRKARPLHHMVSMSTGASPGGISPATIKSVYGFASLYASGLSGAGQHIAIATYNDFNLSDVQSYYTQLSISPSPSVDKVQFNGPPTVDENSAMETQLDAEFSGMIAPGASIHVFSSATNDDAGELAMFTAILNDNRAKVVNYSWGSCETQVTPQHALDMDKVFAQAVAQGVNIMVASGDSGSDSCQDGTLAADWPAANGNIVAVGGTTLTVNGTTGTETAWNGSGGGISKLFALPKYQSGLNPQTSLTGRGYPDVSFNADPASGQAIYAHMNGAAAWLVIGGTSMAAPQWSGFLALVGNARAAKNLAPLGYLNSRIYSATTAQQADIFNDVTAGSNGAFSAAAGWDAVTGLGSMKAPAMLSYLTQD